MMADHTNWRLKVRDVLVTAAADEATDEQLEFLNNALNDNSEAQDYVCHLLQQIGNVRWGPQQSAKFPNPAFPVSSTEDCDSTNSDGLHERLKETKLYARSSGDPIEHGTLSESGWRFTSSRVRVYGAVGVAVATLLVVAAYLLFSSVEGPLPEDSLNHLAKQSAPEVEKTPRAAPEGARTEQSVARLTRVWKPKWVEPGQGLHDWSALVVGQVLEVDSGRVEIFFATGAQLILEGPFRFEIAGPNQGKVHYGNVVTRISEEARGFSLITSVGDVIDYGTEFGLEVRRQGSADLVVFDGEVGFKYPNLPAGHKSSLELGSKGELRLVAGQAARIKSDGSTERIVAVDSARFPRAAVDDLRASRRPVVIRGVTDNIRTPGAGPFYEIVHGGLAEDVRMYVDRTHEWNGVDEGGMPSFLLGADYVRTFNDDKIVDPFEMYVDVAGPADVYLFVDDRSGQPAWLTKQFTDTGLDIGADEASYRSLNTGRLMNKHQTTTVGTGRSIDRIFSVWKQTIEKPTTITLGSIGSHLSSMYGIAAVPLAEAGQTNSGPEIH